MKEKNVKKGKNASLKLGLVSVLVIGIMFSFVTMNMINPSSDLTDKTILDEIIEEILEPEEYTKSWKVVWEGSLTALAAEANPGANTSGFLSVYFHPHQTDGGSYMENSSSNLESNCTGAGLGFANADDTEVDLTHSTSFDAVFRVQGNNTNCKVGGVFYDTNLKVQWTCADLSVSADTELTFGAGEAKTTANDTTYTYLYMNFFDTNSDGGFTISQDQTIEITSIKLLGYY